MEKARKLLIALINSSVFSKTSYDFSESITSEVLEKILKLANYHSVLHLASDGLLKSKVDLDEQLKDACRKKIMQALLRCESMTYELEKICEVLENAEIMHMPLKGAVIRKMYPEPWMRNSCDIDILVKDRDVEKVIELLIEELDCHGVKKTTHDVSVWTKDDIHIEIHYDLLERDVKKNGKYLRKWNSDCLEKVWDFAEVCEGKKYQYEMPDEMLYFYHIAHMAKHIENGGCGIKAFVDLMILNKENENRAKRLELLNGGNLVKFEECMMKMGMAWFSGDEEAEELKTLEEYVFSGGAYGTKQNSVAYNSSKAGNERAYAIQKIWVSEEILRHYYPMIDKKPYLMPLCQVGRWLKIVTKGRFGKSVRELKMNKNVDEKTRSNMEKMYEMLDI